VNSHEGKKPSTTWTRPSGRPRRTWLNHIQDADARPLSTIWGSEVARGHGGALGLRDDDDDDDWYLTKPPRPTQPGHPSVDRRDE